MPKAHPPFKWVGGKRQLLPELLKYVPTTIGTYFEPFLGGGALFFALEHKPAILSDLNGKLVNVYTSLRDHLEDVFIQLEIYETKVSKEHYAHIRSLNMSGGTEWKRAADFLYLNRYGFNGMFRENKKGEFNVPYGDNAKARFDYDNLRAVSEVLQGVKISHAPYQHVISQACPGDFVYFDPPYVPVSETSDFTRYQAEDFTKADQIQLKNIALDLSDIGVNVLLSNSSAELVYEIYKELDIIQVDARRSINSDPTKRGAVKEVLIRPRAPGQSRVAYALV